MVFDEAQSLPASLTSATLRAVNALCSRYHTTMVFSTATQPDFAARKDLNWTPCEILPEHRKLFEALKRVNVEWRIGNETPLEAIAEEMAGCARSAPSSICAVTPGRSLKYCHGFAPKTRFSFLPRICAPRTGAGKLRSSVSG